MENYNQVAILPFLLQSTTTPRSTTYTMTITDDNGFLPLRSPTTITATTTVYNLNIVVTVTTNAPTTTITVTLPNQTTPTAATAAPTASTATTTTITVNNLKIVVTLTTNGPTITFTVMVVATNGVDFELLLLELGGELQILSRPQRRNPSPPTSPSPSPPTSPFALVPSTPPSPPTSPFAPPSTPTSPFSQDTTTTPTTMLPNSNVNDESNLNSANQQIPTSSSLSNSGGTIRTIPDSEITNDHIDKKMKTDDEHKSKTDSGQD